MTREAELELEIARLRKFIFTLSKQKTEELSTPPSTTALQELINEVERRTIERCAEKCETTEIPIDIDVWLGTKKALTAATAIGLATAIRALPTGNLRLEDLT